MRQAILTIPALSVLALCACSREEPAAEPENDGKMALTVGFETPRSGVTKTFVDEGTQILWSAKAVDKVIYVFDSSGAKNAFSCHALSASTTRTFTGNISEGSEATLVLWSGKRAEDDRSVLSVNNAEEEYVDMGNEPIGEGGTVTFGTKASRSVTHAILSGPSLEVVNPQQVEFAGSFATNANIAVMQPGDKVLKSVFGYIRYNVPKGPDGCASIKSVTFTADEDLAGRIEIDCFGADPLAKLVGDGSRSLTVNTPWQTADDGYYEAGVLYAVLPVGTYHNMKVTITPFESGARSKDAATGEPFTISCKEPVVIQRGCYANLGTLPIAPLSPADAALFGSDFFTRVVDDSGVVSYLIRNSSIPHNTPGKCWAYSQSVYFNGNEMTDDGRFLFFMVGESEFVPDYHVPYRSARILDLKTRKLYTFYATDGSYPWLDPLEDKLYYCIRSDDKTTARFYRRDLLVDPGVEIPLAEFSRNLVAPGTSKTIRRAVSHLTLTSDRQKVFIDSWIHDEFHWGLLDLYTGQWDEWGSSTTENVTHGQLNPVHDDEALCAIDVWTDSQGVTHPMVDDPDGTYRRLQYVKKGLMQTIKPNPESNSAGHEGWTADGDHVYFCSGGINLRNIRTDEYQLVMQANHKIEQTTHCTPTKDLKYWVFDDTFPDFYRGGRWKVHFYNSLTGKRAMIHSHLPAITTAEQPSRVHPDPHPHFVCNDKYIICTAAQADGNLHFSITPVEQLIKLTQ